MNTAFAGRLPYGELHHFNKLTEDQVREIKIKLNNNISHRTLAKEYGVCKNTITQMNLGKTYKWIEI